MKVQLLCTHVTPAMAACTVVTQGRDLHLERIGYHGVFTMTEIPPEHANDGTHYAWAVFLDKSGKGMVENEAGYITEHGWVVMTAIMGVDSGWVGGILIEHGHTGETAWTYEEAMQRATSLATAMNVAEIPYMQYQKIYEEATGYQGATYFNGTDEEYAAAQEEQRGSMLVDAKDLLGATPANNLPA